MMLTHNPWKPVESKTEIYKYIEEDFNRERLRRMKLFDYYIGRQAITRRVLSDSSKPNNKIVNPFANYISNTMTGYFMGEPVQYQSANEEMLEALNAVFNYNDESATNSELALDASIFGVAYELMYLDDDKNIRFKRISPIGCIPIYSNQMDNELMCFIRYYTERDVVTSKITTYVEVYDSISVRYYTMDNNELTLIDEIQHSWGLVPINVYKNNSNELGDFETVISLIDAYDKLLSDSSNESDYLSDCFLLLKGMEGTTSDDVADMKNHRVLLVPQDGGAEWLVKNYSNTAGEAEKDRLEDNIHKFSFVPDLTDENFAGNASGVALKLKFQGIENIASTKERYFKKGLQRRIEQICSLWAILGTEYDYREIEMSFNRNIPANLDELADVVSKLGTLYSNRTMMSILPIDTTYDAEMEYKATEQSQGYSDYAEVFKVPDE